MTLYHLLCPFFTIFQAKRHHGDATVRCSCHFSPGFKYSGTKLPFFEESSPSIMDLTLERSPKEFIWWSVYAFTKGTLKESFLDGEIGRDKHYTRARTTHTHAGEHAHLHVKFIPMTGGISLGTHYKMDSSSYSPCCCRLPPVTLWIFSEPGFLPACFSNVFLQLRFSCFLSWYEPNLFLKVCPKKKKKGKNAKSVSFI